MKETVGYGIQAIDGRIGTVKDFYFDDQKWSIRYVVVETGGWLTGRQVLISPASVKEPDWSNSLIHVTATREKIESSPPIRTDMPVSRQEEEKMVAHYEWPFYWGPLAAVDLGKAIPIHRKSDESESTEDLGKSDPHLRSLSEVIGYGVQASDHEVGRVADFLASNNDWTIRLLVFDAGNWISGRKVVVLPDLVQAVEWDTKKIHVDLSEDQVRNSPEFEPGKPINSKQEVVFYDYYGRPASK
ncbi:PRC-barrel domain-containing protein [Thermodesulfobacteriota bacterium]